MAAVIGALRADLSARTAQFIADMGKASGAVGRFSRDFKKAGGEMVKAGAKMSLAVTAPLVALGKISLDNFYQSQTAIATVAQAIANAGRQSDYTVERFAEIAKGLQRVSTFDDDAILGDVTTALLRFGRIGPDIFERVQRAVIDVAAGMKTELGPAAMTVGRFMEDPIKALSRLGRMGVYVSDQQQNLIKSLVATGRVSEAQGIILDLLETKYGGVAQVMAQFGSGPLKQLQNRWGDFTEQLGEVIARGLIPLIKIANDVLDVLERLDPVTLQWVVGLGAVAAAIGPLLIGVGALLRVGALLVPLITAAAAAMLSLAAGTIALLAPFAAIALSLATVAAAVIFFTGTWDEVAAAVEGAYREIKKWLVDKLGIDIDAIIAKTKELLGYFDMGQSDLPVPTVPGGTGPLAEGVGAAGLTESEQKELDRILAKVLPITQAYKDWKAAVDLVTKAGKDNATVMNNLGKEFVDQAGGWEKLIAVIDKLPPALQNAVRAARDADLAKELSAHVDQLNDQYQGIVAGLNDQFDPAAVLAKQMAVLDRAQREGLLNPGVYEKAAAAYQDAFEQADENVNEGFQRTDLILDRIGQSLADINGWMEDWRSQTLQLIQQLAQIAFIDPFIDQFSKSDTLGGFFDTILSGISGGLGASLPTGAVPTPTGYGSGHAGLIGYAKGGTIKKGEWGWTGEKGPEPIFAKDSDLEVFPNGTKFGGGTTQNFYITTPDADSFRRAKRQIGRLARRDFGISG